MVVPLECPSMYNRRSAYVTEVGDAQQNCSNAWHFMQLRSCTYTRMLPERACRDNVCLKTSSRRNQSTYYLTADTVNNPTWTYREPTLTLPTCDTPKGWFRDADEKAASRTPESTARVTTC